MAFLPDYAPALSVHDAANVIQEEVWDTEEEAVTRSSIQIQKRISRPSRPVFSGYCAAGHETPQSSIAVSIGKLWLVSCSLRL